MRSHSCVPVVALVAGVLMVLAAPVVAQVPPGPPLPAPPPEDLVHFEPPNDALAAHAAEHLQVGREYAFDLCRGIPATDAAPGRLNASDSTCGDPLNPSATVRGGNPPYHFQLDTMGGFPPLGMWVDVNGVLRGAPKNNRPATFSVCAVDLSARYECKKITVAPQTPQASASKKSGVSGGKIAAATVLAGGAVAAAVYAGSAMADLATMGGSCASNRNCIVSVMGHGCDCAGSVNGSGDWAGPTAGSGEGCGSGNPCECGLSCNNGRCEPSNGRCPF